MSHSSIWAKLISSLLCCAIQMSTGGAAGTCLACLMLLWAEKQKSEWIPRHKEAFQLVFIVLVWFGFWGGGVALFVCVTNITHHSRASWWTGVSVNSDEWIVGWSFLEPGQDTLILKSMKFLIWDQMPPASTSKSAQIMQIIFSFFQQYILEHSPNSMSHLS